MRSEPNHDYFLSAMFPFSMHFLLPPPPLSIKSRSPKPYKCLIKPRSKEAEALIRSIAGLLTKCFVLLVEYQKSNCLSSSRFNEWRL